MTVCKGSRKVAVTLIELICVIAIIAILASLILGTLGKAFNQARNKVWRMEAHSFHGYIQEHLEQYYHSRTTYPALTAAQLYQQHIFDDRIMDFLRCPHVKYIPFSSTDPTNKNVLEIDAYWLEGLKAPPGQTNNLVLTKQDVTK